MNNVYINQQHNVDYKNKPTQISYKIFPSWFDFVTTQRSYQPSIDIKVTCHINNLNRLFKVRTVTNSTKFFPYNALSIICVKRVINASYPINNNKQCFTKTPKPISY